MGTPPLPGFALFHWLVMICSMLAALTAAGMARRRREHRPVAIALGINVVADVLRAVIHALLPSLAGPVPYAGLTRLAFHAEQGLYLLWPALLVWVSLAVYRGERRTTVIGGLWTGAWLTLVVGYPELHGEQLRLVYLATTIAAVCGGLWAFLTRRRDPWGPAGLCVAALLAVQLVSLLAGAWPRGFFGAPYELDQVALTVGFGFIVLVQGGALLMRAP